MLHLDIALRDIVTDFTLLLSRGSTQKYTLHAHAVSHSLSPQLVTKLRYIIRLNDLNERFPRLKGFSIRFRF